MEGVSELGKNLFLNWDRADVVLFRSEREFQKWLFEENADVIGSALDESEGVILYFVVRRSEPIIAKVKPNVDDYYIPRELAESKLDEFYVAEKGEAYDFEKPALFCRDLSGVFYKLIELSARAGAFADLTPEDAKKLLDMADYIEKMSKLLKRRVLEGVKGYIVLASIAKDERWSKERVEKVFGRDDGS